MFKKIVAGLLCGCLLISNISIKAYATGENDNRDVKTEELSLGEKGGYLASNFRTVKTLNNQIRFTWRTGKGFAGEQANNLHDVLHGKNAELVGGDNMLNGPDRKIINRDGTKTLIQTKYHSTASKSVSDAFDETGMYRYVDKDGKPMQLEVPKGQGKEAIESMEKRIKDGKVKNVTDPAEAKNIIREGHYTFKQAENIAKAGNIDSLKYDAKNGFINATGAMGITFALDFASCMINGDDWQTAMKNASINSLKTGTGVTVIYVISSQLGKAGANAIFKPAAEKVANLLGKKALESITNLYGYTGQKPTVDAVSKIIQSQLLSQTVVLAFFTIPDVVDLFNGKISAKQLAINFAVLLGGTAGANVGAALGTSFGPLGTCLGMFLGGALGSYGADALLTTVFETDAEEMMKIIEGEFSNVSQDYLVSKQEAENITNALSSELKSSKLKDMYNATDRDKFANELIVPLFEQEIKKRKHITMPTEEEVRSQLVQNMEDVVFIH